ncbi:MAG: hypothetical protein ACRD3D_01085 [Terriglobia bacterium]
MAIAYVNSASVFSQPAVTSLAVTLDVAAGNLVVLMVVGSKASAPTITAADTAGNSWTAGAIQDDGTGQSWTGGLYSYIGTGNASDVITVSGLNSSSYASLAALQYSGVASSGALDVNGYFDNSVAGESATFNAGPISTVDANEVIVSCAVASRYSNPAIDSPYTSRQSQQYFTCGDQIVSSTQSGVSVPYSLSAADWWATVVLSFKAASIGPVGGNAPWVTTGVTRFTTHDF